MSLRELRFVVRKVDGGADRRRRPHWVSKEVVEVGEENIDEAAHVLKAQLDADSGGLELVGGEEWWQKRGTKLTGEWIEVRFCVLMRGAG